MARASSGAPTMNERSLLIICVRRDVRSHRNASGSSAHQLDHDEQMLYRLENTEMLQEAHPQNKHDCARAS